jgi:hypothetical protein
MLSFFDDTITTLIFMRFYSLNKVTKMCYDDVKPFFIIKIQIVK